MVARASRCVGNNNAAGMFGNISSAIDVASTGTKAFLEGSIAAAGLGGASFCVANPRTALDAGFLQSHIRCDGTNIFLALGNMTAGALDPTAETVDAIGLFMSVNAGRFGDRFAWRKGNSGRVYGSCSSFSLDHGSIATLTTLEAAAAAITASPRRYVPQVGDVVVCSPRAALPAGLALSHARVSAAGVVTIGLANPTAGAIDPAALTWDVYCIGKSGAGFPASTRIAPTKAGAFLVRPFLVTLNHGSIGALDHLEATFDTTSIGLRGVSPGMPVWVEPTAALPAGIGLSYARVSAGNTLAVDLVNITAGAIDPAAQTYKVAIFEALAT